MRAARALLNLSAHDLAARTQLSRGTIQRAELEIGQTTTSNEARLVETLEALGIIFIPANGEEPGVRLRKKSNKK